MRGHIIACLALYTGCATSYDISQISVYKHGVRVQLGLDDTTKVDGGPEEFNRLSYLVTRAQPLCAAIERAKKAPRKPRHTAAALRELELITLERQRNTWMQSYEVRCCATKGSCPPPA